MTSASHTEGRQFDPGQVYVPLMIREGNEISGKRWKQDAWRRGHVRLRVSCSLAGVCEFAIRSRNKNLALHPGARPEMPTATKEAQFDAQREMQMSLLSPPVRAQRGWQLMRTGAHTGEVCRMRSAVRFDERFGAHPSVPPPPSARAAGDASALVPGEAQDWSRNVAQTLRMWSCCLPPLF